MSHVTDQPTYEVTPGKPAHGTFVVYVTDRLGEDAPEDPQADAGLYPDVFRFGTDGDVVSLDLGTETGLRMVCRLDDLERALAQAKERPR